MAFAEATDQHVKVVGIPQRATTMLMVAFSTALFACSHPIHYLTAKEFVSTSTIARACVVGRHSPMPVACVLETIQLVSGVRTRLLATMTVLRQSTIRKLAFILKILSWIARATVC